MKEEINAKNGNLPYWVKLENEPDVEEKRRNCLEKIEEFKNVLKEIGLENVECLDKIVD